MKEPASLSDILILLFFAVPILVIFRMFWLYWTRGRAPERESASVQYEPPDHLTPGECGALLDNAVAPHNITATIVDLSVKGYLAIAQEGDSNSPASQGSKNYTFHLLKAPSDWNDLKRHERAVLSGIFIPTNPFQLLSESMSRLQSVGGNSPLGPLAQEQLTPAMEKLTAATAEFSGLGGPREAAPRPVVTLLDLQNNFHMHLANIRAFVFDELKAHGYYQQRPDKMRTVYAVEGIFAGVLMVFVGFVLAAANRTNPLPLMLVGILTGAIIVVFGPLLSVTTIAGSRTLAQVLGFKDFLGRVEKDHIERLEKTPELFEKYLPYAMALQVEKGWSQAFAGVTVAAPQWYQRQHGYGFGFDSMPVHLVDDLSRMSNQAASVLTSKPNP